MTLAPGAVAKMVPSSPKIISKELRLKSMGAVVMVLSLDASSKEGLAGIASPKVRDPFLAVVEHTNFVSAENFGGDHIVYVGDYLEPEHEYFRLTQDELLGHYAPHLKKFNPDFNIDWVEGLAFSRNYAQPVPLVNHSKNIPAIQTPIEGLYLHR